MMVITHILLGLVVTLPLTLLGPAVLGPVAAGAILGGMLPDLDLLVGTHRRTLHVPLLGLPVAIGGVTLALVVAGPITAGLAAVLVAAWVHSASDVLGAGEELRPWERTNTDAVYDHLRGRWLTARYLIRYDGSPEDVGLSLLAAVPVLLIHGWPVRIVVGGLLVVAGVYSLLRKRLVPYFEPIV
jgi:hypothetical protein